MTLTNADLPSAKHDGSSGEAGSPGPRAGNAQRRVFSKAYKLRIVQEYDALIEHGARAQVFRIIASQLVEEGQELVGRLVSAGLGVWGCGAGQGPFFEGEMGVKVDLTRSRVLVA